ncbi:hypothetical protein L1987_84691 [Smallanthus sonchifolius]|uniref:Uncharacterized protein n=1 Tax=Smallanthus sonchifolius TaxID=185202 RepID=A0ACB8XTX7_9ASTR|nr:hypothetical protein L1987_84691 [Smallanthus sonchifolius]
MTNHHSLGDASTRFCFLKAWTSIAHSGLDKVFLASGTLPIYDRLVNEPKLDESYLKNAKVETFNEEYQLPRLSGPTDKVRATSRMDPPIPTPYFGNCNMSCMSLTRTTILKEKEGFLMVAKLIGENLYKMLTDKDGILKDMVSIEDMFSDGANDGTPKLKFYDLILDLRSL